MYPQNEAARKEAAEADAKIKREQEVAAAARLAAEEKQRMEFEERQRQSFTECAALTNCKWSVRIALFCECHGVTDGERLWYRSRCDRR